MAKNKIFEQVPLYDLERSKFDLSFTHRTAMFHGDLVPVGVLETMAHDTFTCDVSTFIRMSTPIAPIMGDIDLYVVGVFVPARILWTNWTKFYGADDEIIDISMTSNDLRIPKTVVPSLISYDEVLSPNYYNLLDDNVFAMGLTLEELAKFASIGTYMVKVTKSINLIVNALPFRAYYMTWNWLFRNEYLQEPILIDLSDGNANLSDAYLDYEDEFDIDIDYSSVGGYWITPSSPCLKVNKHGDRFTTSLPWPQKGDPAVIGLSDLAPVITGPKQEDLDYNTTALSFVKGDGSAILDSYMNLGATLGSLRGNLVDETPGTGVGLKPANLYADLRQASAVSINQLRTASAVQRMLEKDAIYGTRYDEKLMAHFGTAPLSEVLNQPQYLGGVRTAINIDTVLQTTGHQAGATTTLAEPGAVSMTYNKRSSLFTQSFTEPGYILLLAYTRHKREYSYIDRLFLRDSKLDFYWPELAHVGYSPVYDIEINESTDIFDEESFVYSYENNVLFNVPDLSKQSIFGYQEYANEYRYKPNMVSSYLNPSYEGSLNFWTLADDSNDDAYLNAKWIQENRTAIARALTTGVSGPDYLVEFDFRIYGSRPMPAFGLPGLSPSF